jgi:hypothetical protein
MSPRMSPRFGVLRPLLASFVGFLPLPGFGPWGAAIDHGSRGWGFESSWTHSIYAIFPFVSPHASPTFAPPLRNRGQLRASSHLIRSSVT